MITEIKEGTVENPKYQKGLVMVKAGLDVESLSTPYHRMEIRRLGQGKWGIRTTEKGDLRESYRPLTKSDAFKVISAALVEESLPEERDIELPPAKIEQADADVWVALHKTADSACSAEPTLTPDERRLYISLTKKFAAISAN